jgi:putative zinc finger/helix-turn-helix YgiT family protein
MELTFCPDCMAMREYDVVDRHETYPVRGEDVAIDARVAVCRVCANDISMPELDDAALQAAFSVYRARHDLLQPNRIRAIRSKYGLGQKAFARLLGWGDVTLARYESGSLQSESHDSTLRLAEEPANVRTLLARNGDKLSAEQRSALEARLAELSPEHEALIAREDSPEWGGGVAVRKLEEMTLFFASMPRMWRTKLNKMLFYSDFLHMKRHGAPISGARYVRMQFGPVPMDLMRVEARLVDIADLDEREVDFGDCTGTVFVGLRPADGSVFSTRELETMEFVSQHFAEWSAKRISDYSHEEPGWLETGDRGTIPYEYAKTLRLE